MNSAKELADFGNYKKLLSVLLVFVVVAVVVFSPSSPSGALFQQSSGAAQQGQYGIKPTTVAPVQQQPAASSVYTCGSVPLEASGIKPEIQKQTLAVSNLKSTQNNLLTKYSSWRQAPTSPTSVSALKTALLDRKKNLIETMRRDPNAAFNSLLQKNTRTTLAGASRECVEAPVTVEGDLEVRHADYFEEKVSKTNYYLVTADKKKYELHLARGQKDFLESRTKVRVSGFKVDSDILVDGSVSLTKPSAEGSGIDVLKQPGNPPVLGEQKVAVILAKFQDQIVDDFETKEEINRKIFGTINDFYKENSYNKISLAGDVFGWYVLPIDGSCDGTSVEGEALKIADNDINFQNYKRVIIIAPFTSYIDRRCPSGIGTIGMESYHTNDGDSIFSTAVIYAVGKRQVTNAEETPNSEDWKFKIIVGTQTIVHELGHNFGNHHARSSMCDIAASLGPEGACTNILEYGDLYDVLGGYGANIGHFNAPHKEFVGWFSPSNILTIDKSGTYTIEPIETATNGLKVLKIPRGVSGNDNLYVEYRQQIGFDLTSDSSLGSGSLGIATYGDWTKAFSGAIIHIGPVDYPYLIVDVTGGNMPLLVGETLRDPKTGTTLTVKSADSNGVTLDITYRAPINYPPEIISFEAEKNRYGTNIMPRIFFEYAISDANNEEISYTFYTGLDAPNDKIEGTIFPRSSYGSEISPIVRMASVVEYPSPPSGTKVYVAKLVAKDSSGAVTTSSPIYITVPWPSDNPATTIVPCTDSDLDGYGKSGTDLSGCGKFIADCDDDKNYVNPSAPEMCNAQDDNCNAQIDEGIASVDAATAEASNLVGSPRENTQGVCKYAVASCANGKWQWDNKTGAARYGWAYQLKEGDTNVAMCNDGVDNDCNGLLDCGTLTSCSPVAFQQGIGEFNNGVCNSFCTNLAQNTCSQIGGTQGEGQGQGQGGGGGYQSGGSGE